MLLGKNKAAGITVASVIIIIAAVLASIVMWQRHGRTVPIEKSWTGKRLASVSFAPFQSWQSPLNKEYPDRKDIDRDLAVIKNVTHGVRVYSSQEGLEYVPELAAAHGLKVIQSAWLSQEQTINRREINSLISLANARPDTITRVIVGNEVLLRKDMSVAELIKHIRMVKASVRQPVSYADVWEMWLKNPELGQEVDFITVHFLPYWEDIPMPVEIAVDHIASIYKRLQEAFPGKPILIGEAGWPDAGRSREGSIPGRIEHAKFINEFCHMADEKGWDYNIIEAFDQPWKSLQEGTVGGHWGILDAERRLKPIFNSQISANPYWILCLSASMLLAAIIAISNIRRSGFNGVKTALWITAVIIMANFLIYGLWREYWQNCLWQDWAKGVIIMAMQALLAYLMLYECSIRMGITEPQGSEAGRYAVIRYRLWTLFSLMAVYLAFMLTINGRYRNFPVGWLLVPSYGYWIIAAVSVLSLKGQWLSDERNIKGFRNLETVTSLMLGLLAVALVFTETAANHEAMFLVSELILMSAANAVLAVKSCKKQLK
jgi:exo-beta-1,3-glucanase (GH17 family)